MLNIPLNSVLTAAHRPIADVYSKDKAWTLPHEKHAPFIPTNNEQLNTIITRMMNRGQLSVWNDVPDGPLPGEDDDPYSINRRGEIHLPHPDAFASADVYQHTVAHELSHTASKPLNHPHWQGFTLMELMMTDAYPDEELTAELTAMGLEVATTGKFAAEDVSLSYLRNWLGKGREMRSAEERWSFAEKQATERLNYLLGFLKG